MPNVDWHQYSELAGQTEQLRVQLAGILVAAEGHAKGVNDAEKGMYGWSLAFEQTKRLRQKYEALLSFVSPILTQFEELEAWMQQHASTTAANTMLAFKVRHHSISFGEVRELLAILNPVEEVSTT